jgi:uncharacterized protein YhaN
VQLSPGLNILYGPNEAGKSSALRAIRALFYGIDARCTDNFVHPYDKLRLAAQLTSRDGQPLAFCRRKGQKHTLRDINDDKPLDDDVLQTYLGAVDEALFLEVFGIDHQRLRKGGEEILKGAGKVGELLFAAGGVANLRACQQELTSQHEQLFKPLARNPAINGGLTELQRLRTEVVRLQASADVWLQHRQDLDRMIGRRIEIDRDVQRHLAEKGRLARILSALPSLSQWNSDASELEAVANVPLLPAAFASQLHEALQRRHLARQREEDAAAEVAALTIKLDSTAVPDALLAEEDVIQRIFAKSAVHQKGQGDRLAWSRQLQSLEQASRELLLQMGRPDDLRDIERHRLADDKQARIRSLANQYQTIEEQQRRASQSRERLLRELDLENAQLKLNPSPPEALDLRQALSRAQAASRLESELAEQERLIAQRVVEMDAALAAISLWNGPASALQQLSVPPRETVDYFEELWRDFQTTKLSLTTRWDEVSRDLDVVRGQLAEIGDGAEIPSEIDLKTARGARDQGWSFVLADWKQKAQDAEATRLFIEQFPPATDLASAFEGSVRRADEVIDRLRSEAQDVATKVQLEGRVEILGAQLSELTRQRNELAAREAEALADWNNRWRDADLTPLTPREMRGWLRQYDAIVALHLELQRAQTTVESNRAQYQQVREQLILAYVSIVPNVDANAITLLDLIGLTEQLLEDMREAGARRQRHADEVSRLQRDLAHAHDELTAAEQSLSAWKNEWAPSMSLLQLEPGASVEQAVSVLTNLAELFRVHRETTAISLAIAQGDADAHEFNEEVLNVARRTTPGLEKESLEDIVASLHASLLDARDARERRDGLARQLNEQSEKLDEAREAHAKATAELAAMCAEAGCAAVDQLLATVERSTQKRALQEEVARLEAQLRLLSCGQSLNDFAVQAFAENPDDLQPRIDALDVLLAELQLERDGILQAEQQKRHELSKMDGNGRAAEQAEECQFIKAQLEIDIRRYVTTRAAASILATAIDRYRKKAEGPIVARASQIFARLTCGSFRGLRTDFNAAGDPVLLGVRQGHETASVDAMSEGACDQLYLALRLATLQHWLEQHEPVPFIVDDVLLSFDNERSHAALVALAELSKQTQVIFFTHHDHLLDIARAASTSLLQNGDFLLSTDWAAN